MTTTTAWFNISILFNFLFVCLSIIFIYKRGGIVFLYQKIDDFFNDNEYNSSVYYHHKKSQFELLPYSDKDIIFLGDSITDQGEWSELFNDNKIRNRGIGGDTVEGILNRIDQILESKPRKIFLMIGINDLASERKSLRNVLNLYKNMLIKIKSESPNTKVFIQSLLPVNNQKRYLYDNYHIIKFNSELKELSKEFDYEYIDVFSHLSNSDNELDNKYSLDGIHLNGQAYLIWKEVIRKYVD
ncbi:GDSL-type esterase/lipase family protein [Nostoc sp. UHCC 0870]|uniref:GDSL-type esterase/lipase family protein n=1 Tax=Nostoc sp. UHCC 0870 TaxID=2914041 RepID=UPI001EDDFD4E|nr:GDSL-type esterase/lipase family protein [Nostoc sp. UHCC 0870]UKO96404.1 GDSL-type esterase/lipase family protein [Nostoc sp. UHCC 0870]